MTELELYKFIKDYDIEYHWHDKNEEGERDVLIHVSVFHLFDFCLLLKDFVNDDPINVYLKTNGGFVCIWMTEICEYYNIDPKNIFTE